MTTLSILTVNLWGDEEAAQRRLRDLAGYLADSAPDVVCCQEVTDVAVDGDRAPAPVHLAAHAGYRVVALTATAPAAAHGERLAVVSRIEARFHTAVALPGDDEQPRGLQLVDVTLPGGAAVRIGNTHLSWQLGASAVRAGQTEAIVAAFDGWDGPAVVAGDLNDVAGSGPLTVLADAGFVDAYRSAQAPERPTFDAANPHIWQHELVGRRVDHILVRGLEARGAAIVLDGRSGAVVSDHYGVLAQLALG